MHLYIEFENFISNQIILIEEFEVVNYTSLVIGH